VGDVDLDSFVILVPTIVALRTGPNERLRDGLIRVSDGPVAAKERGARVVVPIDE
jgi:hypothetical protein